jgi:hypothetical protein
MFSNGYLMTACQTFTGMLLLASALAKLANSGRFAEAVRGFQLVPVSLERVVAWSIIAGEGLSGLALLLAAILRQSLLNVAAVAAMVLFSVFGLAMAVNLLRGRKKISCGCFASDEQTVISWWLVGRNGLLVGTAILAAGWFAGAGFSPNVSRLRRLDAALLGIAILLSWQLISNIRKLRIYNVVFHELDGRI